MIERRRLQHKLSAIELELKELARQQANLNQAWARAQDNRRQVQTELSQLEGRERWNDRQLGSQRTGQSPEAVGTSHTEEVIER